MKAKEAKARIKINKLLEAAGWRFFDTDEGPANIGVEANVKITQKQIDEFGENFEKARNQPFVSSVDNSILYFVSRSSIASSSSRLFGILVFFAS